MIPTEKVLKRALTLSIAGTRGGVVRLRILLMLKEKPLNTNEISKLLSVDYKTAQHHVRVLAKSGLVVSAGKRYDNAFMLSPFLRANKEILEEIATDVGKSG